MKYDFSKYNIVIKENADFIYLYNSYSGAFVKLEKQIYNYVSTNIVEDKNTVESFDSLLDEGIIKPINLNEFNKILLTERVAIYDQSKESVSFVIAPTFACNLRCKYCFEKNITMDATMDNKLIDDIVDYIIKSTTISTRKLHITWFGGEPLLEYEKILQLSEKLKLKLQDTTIKFTSSIITNGVLLNKDKILTLINICNLNNMQITLDGTEKKYCEKKGASPEQYKHVLMLIAEATKYVKVSVRLNCDKKNMDDLKDVAKLLIAKAHKITNLHLYLAKLVNYSDCSEPNLFSQTEFDVQKIEFEKYICQLLNKPYKPKLPHYRKCFCGLFKLKNIVIGPSGELYKCQHYVGLPDKVIGDIYNGIYCNDYTLNYLKNKPLDICKDCKVFPLCLGGCPSQKEILPKGESCWYSIDYIIQLLRNQIMD